MERERPRDGCPPRVTAVANSRTDNPWLFRADAVIAGMKCRIPAIHPTLSKYLRKTRSGPILVDMSRTNFLQDLLATVTERSRGLLAPLQNRQVTVDSVIELCERLMSSRGEASGVALANEVIAGLSALERSERLRFFEILAAKFAPSTEAVAAASAGYVADPSAEALVRLLDAVEPPRQELFRRINLAAGGTRALVELRRQLLPYLRDRPALRAVDHDLSHLFGSWFNRGFLTLKPIDWQTPASVLEKIIRYEAVHAINGWDDLRRRLQPPDRRCFAFFHPALADEPLIFVEVALTDNVPDGIADVLREDRDLVPEERRTVAVFYSISNCQEGLRGISFGNFLIKQVVEDLLIGVPTLKKFVTLSPVPGFRGWLANQSAAQPDRSDIAAALQLLTAPDWSTNPETAARAKAALMPLAAEYFLAGTRPDGQPVDTVARFHLGNGASLDRINWLGDVSEKGLREGAGLMVNYLYDPGAIEENHEAYVNGGRIAASRAVRSLAHGRRERKPGARSDA